MKKWFVFALMGLVTACGAETGANNAAGAQGSQQAVDEDRIRDVMEEAFDGINVTAVRPSPIDGVAEVIVHIEPQ